MRRKRSRLVRSLAVVAWRFFRRIDRIAPDLMRWVPSWGTSLLLHAGVVLLMGLYLYARSGSREHLEMRGTVVPEVLGDFTSLRPSDHAGDPFTVEKSKDPPSISVQPPDANLPVFNQPEMPALARFATDHAGPEPSGELDEGPIAGPSGTGTGKGKRPGKGSKTYTGQAHSEDLTAPFSGRQGALRALLVRREGGSVQSEKAVERGLDWLARHQRADGGWSLNFQGQCDQTAPCPAEVAMESDTAATGLALLPMLGAGHIHTAKSHYQGVIRRGLEWLTSHQQPSGDLYIGDPSHAYLYSHAIGAMTLCEAYGVSKDPKLREPAERAIKFIILAQNESTGGWRYSPGQTGDTSVLGWQMFALRSARLAGITVPKNVLKGCKIYLDLAGADDRNVTYGYLPGAPATPVMTAEALLCRQYLGWPRDFPPLIKGASQVAKDLEQSEDRNIYYWYYATQLLHNLQNKDWQRWNVRVRDTLVALQVKGAGCDGGSWSPVLPQPDRWGMKAGRLYVTALSLLTLEVYYRFLPLYRPSDLDQAHKELTAEPNSTPAGGTGTKPLAP